VRASALVQCLMAPLAASCLMAVLVSAFDQVTGIADPPGRLAVIAVAILLAYAGLFLYGRRERRQAGLF
jgi:hypothetical protein